MKLNSVRRLLVGTLVAFSFAVVARAEDQNPSYKSWAGHKAGTSIKMKTQSEAAGNKTESEMTQTLTEVTPDKVVVEIKSSTSVAGQKFDSPPVKTEIPAKGAAAKSPGTGGDKAGGAKESEETVKIGDKSYKCKVIEANSDANGMKTQSKTWTSEEVPGMLVKMEAATTGQVASNTKMELVEISEK